MGMHEAALDECVGPAGFDCGVRALAPVEDNAQWFGDLAEQLCVGVCGFVFGPVPGDDVVAACGNEQTTGVGVGGVDEDLVVDPVRVRGVGDVDEPERFKPAVERAAGNVQGAGHIGERSCADDIGVERFEIPGLGLVGAAACEGG